MYFLYGSIEGDSFTFDRLSDSTMLWRFRTFGSPNVTAEPGFQTIKSRTSTKIWHEVEVVINCKGDKGSHKTGFAAVSGFPSHRLWTNGVQNEEKMQGSLDKLWIPHPEDETFVAPMK